MKIDWLKAARNQLARFLSKIDKNGPEVRPGLGKCWIYRGRLDKDGYGQFAITSPFLPKKPRQKMVRPHRLVWQLKHGEISTEELILHKCDTRNCCRLGHLFKGNQGDNIIDMIRKRRHRYGEKHYLRIDPDRVSGEANPSAKLNSKIVLAIYRRVRRGESRRAVSSSTGVSRSYISRICSGRAWWCVTGLPPRRRVRPT